MFTLLVLAVYTVLILAFVDLKKIAKAQTWVRNKIKNVKDKIDD